MSFITSSDQTCFVEVERKERIFSWVWHGRFHDIVPKEDSRILCKLLWWNEFTI